MVVPLLESCGKESVYVFMSVVLYIVCTSVPKCEAMCT